MKSKDYSSVAVIPNLDPALSDQLSELKDLIKGDSSLDDFVEFFDDLMLLSFIKGKKFHTHNAFTTLVNYIHIRKKYSNIFKTLVPSKILSLDAGFLKVLKARDEHNRAVLINTNYKWDPREISADDTHKMMMMIMDEFLQQAYLRQIDGMVVVFNMSHFSFDQFKAATPPKVYQMMDLLWKNVPVRYSAFHIVNGGLLMNTLLRSVHPFLPKKARQRLLIHSNSDSLHEHLPRLILPESLGGCLSEVDAFDNEIEQHIRNKEEYYRRFAEKL